MSLDVVIFSFSVVDSNSKLLLFFLSSLFTPSDFILKRENNEKREQENHVCRFPTNDVAF